MISSFFNESKPINYVIVFFITIMAFGVARIPIDFTAFSLELVLVQTVLFFIAIACILILNFIVSKNHLTRKNNYEILLFSLFLFIIPQTTNDSNVLISNFFVLLGLRRIVSLRSTRNQNMKLFDAAIWIAIASLFYFWAILFIALIFLSLALYTDNNVRHWVIPLVGVSTVFLISIAISILWYDTFFVFIEIPPKISYDFSSYNDVKYIIAMTLLASFGVWSSLFYLQNIKKKKKAFRASFKLIILAVIIGFVVVVQSPNKNRSEFLFMFAPLAIIMTNYVEIIQEKWFKEAFLVVIALTPVMLLFL